MISESDYWKGRDTQYPCSEEVRTNAVITLRKVNTLLGMAKKDDIPCDKCSSGWRPLGINDKTANTAKGSKHISGQAIDVFDPERRLAQWCLDNMLLLGKCALYMEDPRWTPTWVHLQIVPPVSGKRVYIPSTAPATAPSLRGQKITPNIIKI